MNLCPGLLPSPHPCWFVVEERKRSPARLHPVDEWGGPAERTTLPQLGSSTWKLRKQVDKAILWLLNLIMKNLGLYFVCFYSSISLS